MLSNKYYGSRSNTLLKIKVGFSAPRTQSEELSIYISLSRHSTMQRLRSLVTLLGRVKTKA